MPINRIILFGYGYIGKSIIKNIGKEKRQIIIISKNKIECANKNVKFIRSSFENVKKWQNYINKNDLIIFTISFYKNNNQNHTSLDLKNFLSAFEKLILISNDKNISRFIFLSSASVYSLKNKRIKNESCSEIPSTNYGKEKLILEKKLKKLNYQIIKIIFRISNIFDNNFNQNKNFIDRLIDNKNHDRFTQFSGSIYDIRDFVNIDFIVKVILISFNIKLKRKYNTFNLSSGYGISYLEIINLLKYKKILFNKKNKETKIILSNKKLFRYFGLYFKNSNNKLKKYIKKNMD